MIKGIKRLIHNVLKCLFYFFYVIIFHKRFIIIENKLSHINIKDCKDTIQVLLHSDKSMGRFGDGEISWLLNKSNGTNSFEKPSKLLSEKLYKVINNDDNRFMVGLPESFYTIENLNRYSRNYFIRFIVNNFNNFFPYLNSKKVYYDANITRPYIDYRNKKDSGLIFYLLKKIWKNKNILLVEGNKSRVGIGDDLFSGVNLIKRIECPSTNAFTHYKRIYKEILKFLHVHKNYLVLLSLGPTATILSLDLCKKGFRAIDIGNVDLEYQWYLMNATSKINIPYKYITEVYNGTYVTPVTDKEYYKEIVKIIK